MRTYSSQNMVSQNWYKKTCANSKDVLRALDCGGFRQSPLCIFHLAVRSAAKLQVPTKYIPYLDCQGDLGSRLKDPITQLLSLVITIVSYLLSKFEPPSSAYSGI